MNIFLNNLDVVAIILSIISLLISLLSFLRKLWTERINIDVEVNELSEFSRANNIFFNFSIINNSSAPVSISHMELLVKYDDEYSVGLSSGQKEVYLERYKTNDKSNKEYTYFGELPLFLPAKGSSREWYRFEFYDTIPTSLIYGHDCLLIVWCHGKSTVVPFKVHEKQALK